MILSVGVMVLIVVNVCGFVMLLLSDCFRINVILGLMCGCMNCVILIVVFFLICMLVVKCF